jgi:hypothetical protein
MEPEGSLLCSQEPATWPYPKPNESMSIFRALGRSKASFQFQGPL